MEPGPGGRAEPARGRHGDVDNTIGGGVFFNAVVQGRDITLHLPPQVTPALSGLPPASPVFTGRERVVEELLRSLTPSDRSPRGPVAVVTGLAGIGKTELAVHTATRATRERGLFPGGVLFVDLAGYDGERGPTPERALTGLLLALGIPAEHVPDGVQDLSRLYRSALAALADQGRPVLVVIDNVATADQARPLLPSDGATAALVTSRHTPDLDARLHELPELDQDASVELLDQVLRHRRGDTDTRVRDEPGHAATTARLCAGLALALRIVAALLADSPTRPLSSLVATLRDEHTRLDRLRREDRAVRAAFDLSYRRLDEAHARLFRLLPVNPGPDLSTEAAAHLADAAADRYAVEELLHDLARAHLVEPGTTPGRWRLHDLVRLYAADRGLSRAEDDHRDEARARLLRHYQAATAAAETHLSDSPFPVSPHFADRHEALAWIDAERPNLVAAATTTGAFATSAAIAFTSPGKGAFVRPTTLGQLPGNALFRCLHHLRHFADLMDISRAALATSRSAGDRLAEVLALNDLGVTLREVRRFEASIDACTRSLALCRELDDGYNEAVVSANLAGSLAASRRPGKALKALARSERIFARVGDRRAGGLVLSGKGLVLHHMRRFTEAAEAQERAVAVFTELADRNSEGMALNNLALSLRELGRLDDSADACTHAVAAFTEAGNRHGTATARGNLGNTLARGRKYRKALGACKRSLAAFRELGDEHAEAETLDNLGIVLGELGRLKASVDAHARACAVFAATGERHAEGIALNNLGSALTEVRRFDEAIDAYTRSVAAFAETGDRGNELDTMKNLDLALRRRGGTPVPAASPGTGGTWLRRLLGRGSAKP
ncbi:tetratricopeptide repeat protein [Saccharothrix sp. BKS2]|uniref:tetratricopeptide repeat protein n=1 Tax=Saccharothrix sp. BKS2 TaxID=3064400 RepID=UPI0039E8C3AD